MAPALPQQCDIEHCISADARRQAVEAQNLAAWRPDQKSANPDVLESA